MIVFDAGRGKWILMALAIGAIGWATWTWRHARAYRHALDQARGEFRGGRFGHAIKRLEDVLRSSPEADEANLLLGNCEKSRGRPGEAWAAWSRVSPRSPVFPQSVRARVDLAVESGRFADAEKVFDEAIAHPVAQFLAPPHSLLMAMCQQGRIDDAERVLEAAWDRLEKAHEGASERAIQLVRLHTFIRVMPIPVDALRDLIDRAGRLAPDDDRVWLARANLAISERRFDDADRTIVLCLERRPADPAAWRVRLRLDMVRNDLVAARKAIPHIDVEKMKPARVYAIAAWFAARAGDTPAERVALEQLVASDPTNVAAVRRLADLAIHDHKPEYAGRLRDQAAEAQRALERFMHLDERNQPIRDAAELARLAVQLGQFFEGMAYLTLATEANPDRSELRTELARLKTVMEASGRSRPTLDAWLANHRGPARGVHIASVINRLSLTRDQTHALPVVPAPVGLSESGRASMMVERMSKPSSKIAASFADDR
jgi:tetratricopeptide (TPR) repeat protein